MKEKMFLLLFLFFLVGTIFISEGYNLKQKETPFENYRFSFGAANPDEMDVRFENFQIFYDFTKGEGKIDFDLSAYPIAPHSLYFSLPNNTKLTGVNWLNTENKQYEDNKGWYVLNDSQSNFLIVNDNDSIINTRTTINITFKGSLIPNAEIELYRSDIKIIAPTGFEDGAFFIYKSGNNYSCYEEQCAASFREGELKFDRWNNLHRVKVPKNNNGWRDVGEKSLELFSLHYDFNKDNHDNGWIMIVIGAFLITTSLTILIEKLLY